MVHYADKRDIGTLEYQMNILCQGHKTVTEFYQQVYQMLSLILDKVSCMELDENSLQAMTDTYREKALDTFIRGLNGDLPKLLSVKGPTSLPQALHLCLKLDNMTFRRDYAQKGAHRQDNKVLMNMGTGTKFYPELANIPSPKPRTLPNHQYSNGFYNPPIQRPQFGGPQAFQQNHFKAPQFPPRPQQFSQQFSQQFPQQFTQRFPQQFPHPNQSRPSNNYQNRPEPMDIDRSMQLRSQQNHKRSAPFSAQVPINKIQRNFHVDIENNLQGDNGEEYETEIDKDTDYCAQLPDELTQEDYQERESYDIPSNFEDINFLD